MKKCPFCAEEIQDEAIKCKHCGSFVSAAPPAAGGAAAAAPAAAAPAAAPEPGTGVPPFARNAGGAKDDVKREMLYEGHPSWKAFIGHYLATVVLAMIVIAIALRLADTTKGQALGVLIPLAVAAVFVFGMHVWRRSIKFRVSNTVIEHERGVLSKRIDVTQLWRVKDVAYNQSLVDRVLGIAHIQVVTSDALNPAFDIVGLPASRKLFEQLRDSIEIQRQSKNVYGVVS